MQLASRDLPQSAIVDDLIYEAEHLSSRDFRTVTELRKRDLERRRSSRAEKALALSGIGRQQGGS